MSSRNILLCLGSTLPKRICRGCQVPTCRSSQVWGGGLGGESPPTPTKVHGRVKGVASSVCSPPGEREGCTEVGEWRWAMILAHRSGMQAGRMIQTRTSKHRGPLKLLDGALRLWWDLVASPNKHRTHKLPDGVSPPGRSSQTPHGYAAPSEKHKETRWRRRSPPLERLFTGAGQARRAPGVPRHRTQWFSRGGAIQAELRVRTLPWIEGFTLAPGNASNQAVRIPLQLTLVNGCALSQAVVADLGR